MKTKLTVYIRCPLISSLIFCCIARGTLYYRIECIRLCCVYFIKKSSRKTVLLKYTSIGTNFDVGLNIAYKQRRRCSAKTTINKKGMRGMKGVVTQDTMRDDPKWLSKL